LPLDATYAATRCQTSKPMHVIVSLKLNDVDALKRFIVDSQHAGNPAFGHS